jgi:hypothetical protein
MAQVVRLPKFITVLMAALEERFPGAIVEVERAPGIDGYRYHLGVAAKEFRRMDRWRRGEAVWDVARELLTAEQRAQITGLRVLRPEDLNGHDDANGDADEAEAAKPRRRAKRAV